ncbi:MAG: CCA tRNA nucleotidyltransferase [Acidimicrobiales bacterium]|nr:CCA tRNA nucleotidyltransferase [Acidimicrobiales bacterium]
MAELLDTVRPLASVFAEAGHSLYLVGGIVRDQLRGLPLESIDDIDLTTDARPARIKKLVGPLADAVWTQGERFGTIGLRIGDVDFEITTFRAEVYRDDSRKPQVAYADAVDADLARRDFTINAIARALPSGQLVDPHGGLADLEAGVLRTPLDPLVSFGDDPLRMLRAARFMARMGVEPEAEMAVAISAMVDRIDIVSVERIRDELVKLLRTDDPTAGVELLVRTGLVDHCLPDLRVVSPTAVRDVAGHGDERALNRLALIWLGKTPEEVSAAGHAVRLSNEQVATVRTVVDAVHRAQDAYASGSSLAEGFGAEAVRRIAYRAKDHLAGVHAVYRVVDPDAAARLQEEQRRLEVEGEDLSDWSLPLGGEEIMALLDLHPGPAVGEAAASLRELRFREGPISVARARQHLLAAATET